jgi:hypothetical protein
MEVETILGFIALACFVLALFIVLVARIASARRNRAKRKEKAEELTRINQKQIPDCQKKHNTRKPLPRVNALLEIWILTVIEMSITTMVSQLDIVVLIAKPFG